MLCTAPAAPSTTAKLQLQPPALLPGRQRTAEQDWVLGDDCHLAAQRVQRHGTGIQAIDADGAACHRYQAEEGEHEA